jgi:ABC-type transporter Mla subunit MlaD
MKNRDAYRQFESDAQVLKRVSEQYAATSEESQALQRAALSLAYVVMNHQDEFSAFVEEMGSDLSDKQRQQLHDRYGIES